MNLHSCCLWQFSFTQGQLLGKEVKVFAKARFKRLPFFSFPQKLEFGLFLYFIVSLFLFNGGADER